MADVECIYDAAFDLSSLDLMRTVEAAAWLLPIARCAVDVGAVHPSTAVWIDSIRAVALEAYQRSLQ